MAAFQNQIRTRGTRCRKTLWRTLKYSEGWARERSELAGLSSRGPSLSRLRSFSLVPTPSSATLIGSTSEFLFVNNVATLGITLDLASFETAVSDPIQNFADKSFAFANDTASGFEAGNFRFS